MPKKLKPQKKKIKVKRKVITRKKAAKKKVGSFYHPTKKTTRTGKCPKKKIVKKAYKRKAYTRSDGTRVKASKVKRTCVKNKGAKGKTMAKYKVIGQLKEGKLKKYGYSTKKNMAGRLRALKKSVKKVGYDKTVERLTALRVLSRGEKALKKKYDGDYKRLKVWYNKHKK